MCFWYLVWLTVCHSFQLYWLTACIFHLDLSSSCYIPNKINWNQTSMLCSSLVGSCWGYIAHCANVDLSYIHTSTMHFQYFCSTMGTKDLTWTLVEVMAWYRLLSHMYQAPSHNQNQCWSRYIDGLVQERHNSSASAMELRFSCTNPSICRHMVSLACNELN